MPGSRESIGQAANIEARATMVPRVENGFKTFLARVGQPLIVERTLGEISEELFAVDGHSASPWKVNTADTV